MTLESREPRVAEKEATLVSPLGGALVDLLMTRDELAEFSARAGDLTWLAAYPWFLNFLTHATVGLEIGDGCLNKTE